MTESINAHFLTDIEIKEFKCFKDFNASGFKRVNLIGGKNNIGKTAFMEACYINTHSVSIDTMITAITSVKIIREKQNLISKKFDYQEFLDFVKNYLVKSNLSSKKFHLDVGDGVKKYQFIINENSKAIKANDLNVNISYVSNARFIDSVGWSDKMLVSAYKSVQKLDKENELNDFLKEFDSSIENFKVIGDKPQCKTNGEYRDITEFGDGLKHYISIICALYACENGYLFIDEIDNGIHYTQLDRLWEIILTLSKTTNCQVFATTHSKEMLESFARVAKRLNEQDISFTTLVKNKNQELKALTRDYEMILDGIEDGREVR